MSKPTHAIYTVQFTRALDNGEDNPERDCASDEAEDLTPAQATEQFRTELQESFDQGILAGEFRILDRMEATLH